MDVNNINLRLVAFEGMQSCSEEESIVEFIPNASPAILNSSECRHKINTGD